LQPQAQSQSGFGLLCFREDLGKQIWFGLSCPQVSKRLTDFWPARLPIQMMICLFCWLLDCQKPYPVAICSVVLDEHPAASAGVGLPRPVAS